MLKRFNRYPLVVDPSGQATGFLMKHLAAFQIAKTSFTDASFLKHLESAMRFGTLLLITDVEAVDPILNPVLNREITKAGGRVLMRLGDQDIDFSPSFSLYLSTRDSSCRFSPDLCSRTTVINFTVTPGGLQSQCLSAVLKAEQPEVELQRSELIKSQGEYRSRLMQLEKALLHALRSVLVTCCARVTQCLRSGHGRCRLLADVTNVCGASAAEGNILDDDSIVATLQRLKTESRDIESKMDQSEHVRARVQQVTRMYEPLADAASRVYFSLQSLREVSPLYQFSVRGFLHVFNRVVAANPNLADLRDKAARLRVLTHDTFQAAFHHACHSLQERHRLSLALRLAQIRLISQV